VLHGVDNCYFFYNNGNIEWRKIIWVDIYIPDDLKDRSYSNKKLSDRIELITGSSIEEENINKIKKLMEIQKMYS